MKKMLVPVIATVGALIGFSSSAKAECSAAGCHNVRVTELYLYGPALGFLIQSSGDETLANCVPSGGIFLQVPESTAHLKEIYATLLTVQLSDNLGTIRINEGTNPCTVAYIKITSA